MHEGDEVISGAHLGVGQQLLIIDHHLPHRGPGAVLGLPRLVHLPPEHRAVVLAQLVDLQELDLQVWAVGGKQAEDFRLTVPLCWPNRKPLQLQE